MSKVQTKNNTLYLPKEKVWVNPKCFKLMTEKDIYNEIPWDYINRKPFQEVYGSLSKLSLQDPVSNLPWDNIRFLDSDIFRPAGLSFLASKKANKGTRNRPSYTPHIKGTTPYKLFWKEEYKRILYGYEPIVDGEPCGIRIPGEFYFYLNYGIIQKISRFEDGTEADESTLPDFLAMDYYYFRELEARENPILAGLDKSYKKPISVAKSRRKGFSFKAAVGCVWLTAFPPLDKDKPKVIIASDTGYDATLCFKKCMPIIDHLTDYTPFGREQIGDPASNGGWKHIPVSMTNDEGHFIFGFENTKTKQRKGRLTEIQTVSLVKADKISGEGVQRIYFEEAGKITHLKKAWTFAVESLKAGSFWRGIAIIFGTGGSMAKEDGSKGSSRDFSELFLNPELNELGSYDNIYEYNDQNKKCGYFVSDMWSHFDATVEVNGKIYDAIDKNGNAIFWVAELALNKMRELKKQGKRSDYDLFLTQRCKTPSEAFLVVQGTIFPTAELLAVKSEIESHSRGWDKYRIAGELVEHGKNIIFKPDYEGKLFPIDTYVVDDLNREGCLLRYEEPMKLGGVVPEGAYIISVDPIGQNTVGGKSLTSIIVMKTSKYASSFGNEKIVATYRGRHSTNPQGYVQELLVKLSKYYNAQITFENDRDGGILQYFTMTGQLSRLMSKPQMTLDRYLSSNSKTLLREYGHSMGSDRHKRIGEDLLLAWLLKRHPTRKLVNEETGEIEVIEGLRNIDCLQDRALIEDLIHYKRESGNYDVAMAMMGAIIQLNEHFNEELLKARDENIEDISSFWVDLYTNRYGSNYEKEQQRKMMNKNNYIND